MTTYLLDANVLIALTIAEHEHHERASSWLATVDSVAVCPVTEGALIRFMIRIGESTSAAAAMLRAVRAQPRCAFWPDAPSYIDVSLAHVRGHRQVTDAYLTHLARSHGGLLATLDQALAADIADAVTLLPRI